MIINIIIVFLAVGMAALAVNYFEDRIKKNKKRISFRETMDLVELPIITFYINDNKLNFLLDTGSNLSFIDPKVVSLLGDSKAQKAETSVIGCGGNTETTNKHNVVLIHNGDLYDVELNENPALTESFNAIKERDGVRIHGILGSLFFQKYKYILNFDELVAYKG